MLFYSDSPLATTGLGRLTRYLLPRFADKFEITQVAMNHAWLNITPEGLYATYDENLYKWKIIPAANTNDPQGIELMKKLLSSAKYDVVFTSCDMNLTVEFLTEILIAKEKNGTKWINYTPIDRVNVLNGEHEIFTAADACVVLSKYAKRLLEKKATKKVYCIYHPLDLNEFPEVTPEDRLNFRQTFFAKWKDNSFIIGNVGRNQFRKDLARSVFAFNEYSKLNPRAKFYLHTSKIDSGGDLSQNISELNTNTDDIALPDIENQVSGVTQEFLNNVYHSLDVLISTSKGEGWGFSTIEAMACKVPVIVPNNTSFTEQVGENEDRGYLSDCKEFVFDYAQSNCMRMLTDVPSLVEKLDYVYKHPVEAAVKTELAYRWVKNHLNLDKIHEEWNTLFKELGLI